MCKDQKSTAVKEMKKLATAHWLKLDQYIVLATLILTSYLLAMFVPVMEVDAAQYASISAQMLENGNFLQVKHRHFDYLDKPPLLFWLSALSMYIFGLSSFAYKLPSVLANILTIYATYRFASLYYPKQTAKNAALILATCFAFFLISNDCRTDNLLIAFSMYAIWKQAAYLEVQQKKDLYLSFVGIGMAMLAKGPLGAVYPGMSIGVLVLTKKYWSRIGVEYLIGILILGLVLAPMCYGLYLQHGMEGIEFYFWKQSFGRITGENEWKNDTGPLFLTHTFLWSFIPYTPLFIGALFSRFKDVWKRVFIPEVASFATFFALLIALSLSKYQLPHYIYLVCPMAAIICAHFIQKLNTNRGLNAIKISQLCFNLLLSIAAMLLYCWFTDRISWFFLILWIIFFLTLIAFMAFIDGSSALVLSSASAMIFVAVVLFTGFYPKLLKYQAASETAFYIKLQGIDPEAVACFKAYDHSLSFYTNSNLPYYDGYQEWTEKGQGKQILYTNEKGSAILKKKGVKTEVLKSFVDYPIAFLQFGFLNPETRSVYLEKRYLLKIKK